MINELIKLANALDESGFNKESDRVDALIKSAIPEPTELLPFSPETAVSQSEHYKSYDGPSMSEIISDMGSSILEWWDNNDEIPDIPGYNPDWIKYITGPEFAHGPSPGFRMYIDKDGNPTNVNSKLINDPDYYPTEAQIKQDPRFCYSDFDSLRASIEKYCGRGACGGILDALGRDDGGIKSYRQLLSLDEYGGSGTGVPQLHLKFDSAGKMILKDMEAPKGESHTGGSHWDSAVYWKKFDIPPIGEICAPADVGGLLRHALTDAVPGTLIDKTEEVFGGEDSYGYSPYPMTGSFDRHSRTKDLEYWEDGELND